MSYFYFCFESINVFIILEDNKKMDHKINVSLEEIYQTIQNVDSYKVLEPKWVSIKQSFKKKKQWKVMDVNFLIIYIF